MNLDRIETLQTIGIILGAVLFLFILIFFKSLKRGVLSVFGGSIELSEVAGCIFLGLFTYMIIKEGNREHEWHYYNELYIFFTAGAAMTGLGLKDVLNTVKEIRTNGVSKTETLNISKTTSVDNNKKDESEAPQ